MVGAVITTLLEELIAPPEVKDAVPVMVRLLLIVISPVPADVSRVMFVAVIMPEVRVSVSGDLNITVVAVRPSKGVKPTPESISIEEVFLPP
jgi:hypothetical protein